MTALFRSRRRVRPLAVLAGTLAVLLLVVLIPLFVLLAGQSDEVVQARADLAASRAQIAARPRLQAELAALERQESQTGALLGGTSTALAAASMQSLVKELVEHHGGQMRSAQTLAASATTGLEKVQVQFELSLPLGSLKAATYELESKAPYLFLDEVEIRPEQYTGAAATAPGSLHVTWTVHGYRRLEAP